MIAHALMGDPNASISTPQPYMYRPMFGSYGQARAATSATFVSQASLDFGMLDKLHLTKMLKPVLGCRTVTKKSLIHNGETPEIWFDPRSYSVSVNGEALQCKPVDTVPMSQLYFLT